MLRGRAFPRSRIGCAVRFALFLALVGGGAAGVVAMEAEAEAPASAVDLAEAAVATASPGDPLRGTVDPLRTNASPVRVAARGLLLVPWTAFAVASLPIEGLAYVNEKHRVLQRVASLASFQVGAYRSTVGPLFGYASSTGLSPLGLTIRNDDWLGAGLRFRASGGWRSDRENVLAARVARGAGPWRFDVSGELYRVEDLPFYGIGSGSPDQRFGADREQDLVEGRVEYRRSGARFAVTGWSRRQENRRPAGDVNDAVADAFPALAASAATSSYAGAEAELALDSRDRGPFSTRGSLLRVTAGFDFARSTGDADYRHWSAEAQHFITLRRGVRALALRAEFRGIESDDPDAIPYPELESIGGKTGPRGVSRHRFTDLHSAVLSVEYRYRVTQRFEGRLFVDWGAVAPEVDRLQPGANDPSYGFGLAVPSENVPLIFEIAAAGEGVELRVGFGSLFDERSRRRNR